MSEDKIETGKLTFHHIGLIVANLNESVVHYADLFGKQNLSEILFIPSQKVNVCFVKTGPESYIELVEPIDESSVVYNLLKKRITYYHIAYKVADITETVSKLEKLHYKSLEYFTSEAFENKKCIFLFTPDGHLMELIEQ